MQRVPTQRGQLDCVEVRQPFRYLIGGGPYEPVFSLSERTTTRLRVTRHGVAPPLVGGRFSQRQPYPTVTTAGRRRVRQPDQPKCLIRATQMQGLVSQTAQRRTRQPTVVRLPAGPQGQKPKPPCLLVTFQVIADERRDTGQVRSRRQETLTNRL